MSGTRKRRVWPWLAGIVAFIVVVAVVVTAAVMWSDRSGTTVAAAPGPDPAPEALLPATDAGPLPD
ncbi:D-alanyl-D-alanine carboxypeptidase/D-alanyl-D-alanine-endopeptidase, partial [Corynebacterium bovis]